MATECTACFKAVNTIYFERGVAKCLSCTADAARRRYWAQKEPEGDPYGSVRPGPCFLCDGAAQYGVLRELSRDGNSETCPTWICWTCHTTMPTPMTLFDYETKAGVEECE